ncbi:MAG: DUF4166 domain-containing protein [Xanthobacteraceae bacterium]
MNVSLSTDDAGEERSLYARILGRAWHALPAPIRDMHDVRGTAAAEGRANVERGRSLLARPVSTIVGFPRTGSDIPVHVQFEVAHRAEIWRRKFGSAFFSNRQLAGPSICCASVSVH